MSLRCTGNQLLETPPCLLLDGASEASASFWIRVNPGNAVANGGVEVFGDSGGVFSATLSGTGLLQLRWVSSNGVQSSSSCSVGLAPGISYHVATAWQAGSQQYYLDGVQIGSDTQGGTLGAPVSSARPFRLGSDQAGVDVTLDRPTLWVGYALTPQDVVALRDGTAPAAGIAPGSVALQWSLQGADGAQAAAGDPGLADASPNHVPLSTIVGTAPTYQAGDLSFVPGPLYGKVTAAPSGESIVLLAQDPQGNPLKITSVGSSSSVQVLTLTGKPAGDAITLTFNGQATAPIPTTTTPPATSLTWTVPTTAGHTYDIAVNWWADGPSFGVDYTGYYFEFLNDSGQVVATFSPTNPPANEFIDPDLNSFPFNSFWYWIPIVGPAGLVAPGTSLSVRLSGPSPTADSGLSSTLWAGGLRVADRAGASVVRYDLTNTSNYATTGGWTEDDNAGFFGGKRLTAMMTGAGGVTVFTPVGGKTSAQVLQAALEALPAIGAGNIAVTDLTRAATPNIPPSTGIYQVAWGGTQANLPQPAITASDPATSIQVVNPGGTGFTLYRASTGTTTLLEDIVWSGAGAPVPYILLPLSQPWPAVKTWPVRTDPWAWNGYWDGPDHSVSGSLSGNPVYGWSAGHVLDAPARALPVGTYQWAITWPPASFTIGSTTYSPSTATQFLVKNGSGNILATYSVDQTQAPASYTDSNGTPWHVLGSFTISQRDAILTLEMTTVGQSAAAAGQVQQVAILDAAQFVRTSPDTSILIEPGDTLTVSAGYVSTASGPLPALIDAPIAPASPTAIMPAFEPSTKTMKLGYGLIDTHSYDDFPTFSNLAYLIPTMGTVQDANGYPTRYVSPDGGPIYQILLQGDVDPEGFSGASVPYGGSSFVPPGRYILAWDGSCYCSLSGSTGTTVTQLASTTALPAGAPANFLIFDVEIDHNLTNRPCVTFIHHGTGTDPSDPSGQTFITDLRNLMVYPPDPADPTGQTAWGLSPDGKTWTKPPKFMPSYVAKLSGVNALRFMDPLNTNQMAVGHSTDFKPDTHANRCSSTYYRGTVPGDGFWPGWRIPIASIRGTTGGEVATYGASAIVIETATPHGLFIGSSGMFGKCGPATFSTGVHQLDFLTEQMPWGVNAILGPTTLVCGIGFSNLGSLQATVTPPAGGSLVMPTFGTNWSLQDICDLFEAVGPSCTRLHFNAPLTMDATLPGGDSYQVAQFLAAHLPSWVEEVAVEPANEVWNSQFPIFQWARAQTAALTGKPMDLALYGHAPFYAAKGKAIWDSFDAAFVAAGRPGVVRNLVGSMATFGLSVAGSIMQQVAAIGGRVDEVSPALYVNPGPCNAAFDPAQCPIFNRMTTGQLLDYAELNTEYGGYDTAFTSDLKQAIVQYGFPNAKLCAYEGSMSACVPWAPPYPPSQPQWVNTPDAGIRQKAATRHPRMYSITLRQIQKFQDAGMAAWCYYSLGDEPSLQPWGVWSSATQPAGTGDPIADAAGITDPMNADLAPNQIGGAVRRWATLVPSGSTSGTGTGNQTGNKVVRRNGRIAATGLFKGVARPTRFR